MDLVSLRRLNRREYLRQYAESRRAAERAAGARRIDVTLWGVDLERFGCIAQWLEETLNTPAACKLHDALEKQAGRPLRRSDPQIIRAALRLAVDALEKKDRR